VLNILRESTTRIGFLVCWALGSAADFSLCLKWDQLNTAVTSLSFPVISAMTFEPRPQT
jgi:hypothetical protein